MGKMTVRYALSRETAGGGGKKHNKGFTLLETLLVVAILVILLCLAMVGVARWRDYLKITELDNAARAIYMAAENRVVLLRNNGTAASLLSSLSEETVTSGEGVNSTTTYLRVLSSAATGEAKTALNELLPEGVIDPALRDGNFYILYDKNTYHVFEVFYAEGKLYETDLTEEQLKTMLGVIRGGNRSKRVNDYRNKAVASLVGHYAGGLAGGPDPNQLPTPGVEVLIANGEELTLTVKYTMPTGLPSGVTVNREPSVTLKYEGEVVELWESGRKKVVKDITSLPAGETAEYTWVLDSLDYKTKDASGNSITVSQPFKGLFDSTNMPDALGGDFTVTASLKLSAAGYTESSYYAKGTDNSLFGTDTHDGETAYIVNLRHLQNLDNPTSGAARKSTAVQLKDIDASTVWNNAGEKLNEKYEFKPIQNWDLLCYRDSRTKDEGEGRVSLVSVPYSIKNLNVTKDGTGYKGLFSGVNNGFKFQNVRIVDSNVAGNVYAGAFAGTAPDTSFFNCWVVNSSVESVSEAGGLAGYWWGSIKFDNCRIENLNVKSTSESAGGLAGGGPGAEFTQCNAQDIEITAQKNAGGLTGYHNGSAEYNDCHVNKAAVKSEGADTSAGGLVGSTGYVEGENKETVEHPVEFTSCTTQNTVVIAQGYAGGLMGLSETKDKFDECKVVNAKIGNVASEAGGLVGRSWGGSFTKCRVYWENIDYSTLKEGTKLKYQVVGVSAGGLVGVIKKGGSIDTCFAATLVQGKTYAGGLVGNLANPKIKDEDPDPDVNNQDVLNGLKVTINKSYADCYLQVGMGDTSGNIAAGGLIGVREQTYIMLNLTNVYAAGFIDVVGTVGTGNVFAGLCGGWGEPNISAENAYAAMDYNVTGSTLYPFAAGLVWGGTSNCWWLKGPEFTIAPNAPSYLKTYNELKSVNMGSEFDLSKAETHSYGLSENASTDNPYPFRGLIGLPHYGDWPKP